MYIQRRVMSLSSPKSSLTLTIAIQVHHGDDHEQRVQVELHSRVGSPGEAAAEVAHPHASQHHRHKPGRLKGQAMSCEYGSTSQIFKH